MNATTTSNEVNGTAKARPAPLDAAGYEARLREIRESCSAQPLDAIELAQSADLRWAYEDPEVRARHSGEFVVAHEKRIVASGADADDVMRQAVAVTSLGPDRLVLVALPTRSAEFLGQLPPFGA